tara:strand:+ start:704 stop:1162 length:459 start_codon:yes stop_codon:yes gene_type:complete
LIPLPPQPEATTLTTFQEGNETFQATPQTHAAWQAMRTAAESDGIELILVSAFRSIQRQQELVQAKRKKGLSDTEIFRVLARPGFSEHHTGRALDLHTPQSALLQEEFETTPAFQWLNQHAHSFHFHLSYPRDNPHGIIYEPWHWCFQRGRK